MVSLDVTHLAATIRWNTEALLERYDLALAIIGYDLWCRVWMRLIIAGRYAVIHCRMVSAGDMTRLSLAVNFSERYGAWPTMH
jgi:hypothetical protein